MVEGVIAANCHKRVCHDVTSANRAAFFPQSSNLLSPPPPTSSSPAVAMDGPRRGIVRPSMDPYSHMRSGMAPPSSSMKKLTPSAFRQSLAGPQQPFLHSGPRQSLYPSQSLNVPPSASKMGNPAFGKTPMRKCVAYYRFEPVG